MKKLSDFEWHKQFKKGSKNLEVDERNGPSGSHRTDENVQKVQNLVHLDNFLNINTACYVEIQMQFREAVFQKGPQLRPMTMPQLTRLSPSNCYWPKNRLLKWNTHPVPLIWLRMTSGCFRK